MFHSGPISVLHFLWSGAIGGAPRAVYQLVRAQMEHGESPAVAFAQADGEYFDRIRALGCEVLGLGVRSDWRLWRSFGISRHISQFPVHHFHSPELTLGLASIMSRDSVRVYTHRAGRTNYTGLRRQRYRIFGSYLRRAFHGLSGNTEHATRAGERLFHIDRRHWDVTYNGLYFEELTPLRSRSEVASELGMSGDYWIIGTSGSLRDWKRTDWLLSAVATLGQSDVRILIIGDGPARAGLIALADRLGIRQQTIVTGMKARVGDYLQLADVFALPSTSAESFGNSAVEAMALGIPTIVSKDGGGLREHVNDGESGLVISGVDDLAQACRRLRSDKEFASRLGKAGQEFVRSRYTTTKMFESYMRLYQTAAQKA